MCPVPGGRGRGADELRPELHLTRRRTPGTAAGVQVGLDLVAEQRIADTVPPPAPRPLPANRIEHAALNLPAEETRLRAPVAAAFSPRVLAAVELGGQAVSIRGTVTNRVDSCLRQRRDRAIAHQQAAALRMAPKNVTPMISRVLAARV